MYVQPYVCFNGRCEEALRFYEHAIGARVSFLFRFDEAPGPVVVPEGWCDKVMHANLQIGLDMLIMTDDITMKALNGAPAALKPWQDGWLVRLGSAWLDEAKLAARLQEPGNNAAPR